MMEEDFEKLIQGFIDDELGVSARFIPEALAHHLKSNLLALHQQQRMPVAGIGGGQSLLHNAAIRNDRIYWMDRSHNDAHENEFLDRIDVFIQYLNRHCYTGIQTCEFHYALYEPGSFYKKHHDQFNDDNHRLFSLITYLNDQWEEGDGGELLVYQASAEQRISPIMGKTVFFKSDQLAHEVLVTHKARLSITGWLKRG